MKTTAIIVFLLIFNFCYGQNKSDYMIYSTIIEDYFTRNISTKKTYDNAIIFDKLKGAKNHLNESFDDFKWTSFKNPVDSITKKKIHKMYLTLKNLPSVSREIKIDSFKCSKPLHLIKNYEFDSLFAITPEDVLREKQKIYVEDNTTRGWRKFYNKFPKAIGVFGFTKIIYSGDLALLFVEFQQGNLTGHGNVYVMQMSGNSWKILTWFILYES